MGLVDGESRLMEECMVVAVAEKSCETVRIEGGEQVGPVQQGQRHSS